MSAGQAPPTPEEVQQWIEALRAARVSPEALAHVAMAEDTIRRAFQDPDGYVRYMELADRQLKAARDADRAWVKSTVKALKDRRDRGDAIAGRLAKLGRPHVVEH